MLAAMRLNRFLLVLIVFLGIALPVICLFASYGHITNVARANLIAQDIAGDPTVSQQSRTYAGSLKESVSENSSLGFVFAGGFLVAASALIVLVRLSRTTAGSSAT